MKKVRITKMAGKQDSSHEVGSWFEGFEMSPPGVGSKYSIDAMDGDNGFLKGSRRHYQWFMTTRLAEIDGDLLITQNSTWKREVIHD